VNANNQIMREKRKRRGFMKREATAWLIMLPTILLFAFFVWEPLLESVRLSLYTAKGIRLQHFAGFDNYALVLQHPDFMAAFGNTFKYILWSLVIGFLVPIVIAVLITETVHLKSFFKIGVYFPNIMPGMAMVMMWGYFFRPGKTGVLNILLGKLGIEPLLWLTNPKITIPLIVLTMTWRSAGSTSLIYMAGINGINPELYEAATLDGARILQRIRYITIPNIFSLGKTLFILQIIAVFQILYEPLVMTNGGPNNASISIMQLVYNYAFRDYNYPAAAALSVMMCIVLVILSGLYFKLTKSKEA
jgi:multiple sugar transport system permease protein